LAVRTRSTGPAEPGGRAAGEFLHEQHIGALTARQLDDRPGRGPAGQQVGGQDPQHRPGRGRLVMRDRAGAHRDGQGRPGCRGGYSRARAGKQQRADPRGHGYLRGQRQQRHRPRLGQPETVSTRQPGASPARQRAGHRPLHPS
jgi:hypothetical protein